MKLLTKYLPLGIFTFFLIRIIFDFINHKEVFNNVLYLALFGLLFLEKLNFETLKQTSDSQKDLVERLIKSYYALSASFNKAIQLASKSDPKLALTLKAELDKELGEIRSNEQSKQTNRTSFSWF